MPAKYGPALPVEEFDDNRRDKLLGLGNRA